MNENSKHKAGGPRLRPLLSVYFMLTVGRDYTSTELDAVVKILTNKKTKNKA